MEPIGVAFRMDATISEGLLSKTISKAPVSKPIAVE